MNNAKKRLSWDKTVHFSLTDGEKPLNICSVRVFLMQIERKDFNHE